MSQLNTIPFKYNDEIGLLHSRKQVQGAQTVHVGCQKLKLMLKPDRAVATTVNDGKQLCRRALSDKEF